MIIQLTGLSGSGKSTLSELVLEKLNNENFHVEILDGDVIRKSPICKELTFSNEDRKLNIERLFYIAEILEKHNVIVIIAAINPFDELRNSFKLKNKSVKTVFIKCDLETLIKRDIKGLYKKALLPDNNKEKIKNLTGINSIYEVPINADLIIETDKLTIEESVNIFFNFIKEDINLNF